ncbi:hypothetical protein [Vibrio sp. Evd11]|uniref:IS66 family insertion sequence element accessory protein TnpA n=1 Tax=Vibrio sp. Evd11 TaxID=1207404 RepID=UPI000EFACBC8|nr:hypothetical protein [Vibrio sp. Evd11]
MTQSEKHQHWTAIVFKQQESGLSIPHFCKEHDINYATFHYWLKKLKQTDDEQVAHQVVMNDLPSFSGEMVVVHLPNGLRAELPTSLSLVQIQTWLKALQ